MATARRYGERLRTGGVVVAATKRHVVVQAPNNMRLLMIQPYRFRCTVGDKVWIRYYDNGRVGCWGIFARFER